MTSSTKPEVHNISHFREMKTEPRPLVTYRKFGENWTCGCRNMRVDRQTDRHTDTLFAILCTPADEPKDMVVFLT